MPAPGLVAHARPTGPRPGRPTVSCIRFANRPKGYRLLPRLYGASCNTIAMRGSMIHGVVGGSDAEPTGRSSTSWPAWEAGCRSPGCAFAARRYLAWLSQADLLLLPYDPEVYRSRGSGVFSDARAIGIPVVAPQGCAFAKPAFDDGWGVAIEEYSGTGLGSAILSALGRLDDLGASANLAANQAHDELGRVLQTTLDGLGAAKPAGLAGMIRRWSAKSA